MGRNVVLMGAGQGLTGGELINSFRASDIFKNYRFKEEIMRHAATIDFANYTESDLQDRGFREKFPTYLRPINRILRNGFNGKRSSNWGYQIRMIIRECRIQRIAMAETEEMAPIEHFREEIDQVDMLTVLMEVRVETRIIGIIMMKRRVIRAIMGIVQKGKRH